MLFCHFFTCTLEMTLDALTNTGKPFTSNNADVVSDTHIFSSEWPKWRCALYSYVIFRLFCRSKYPVFTQMACWYANHNNNVTIKMWWKNTLKVKLCGIYNCKSVQSGCVFPDRTVKYVRTSCSSLQQFYRWHVKMCRNYATFFFAAKHNTLFALTTRPVNIFLLGTCSTQNYTAPGL